MHRVGKENKRPALLKTLLAMAFSLPLQRLKLFAMHIFCKPQSEIFAEIKAICPDG